MVPPTLHLERLIRSDEGPRPSECIEFDVRPRATDVWCCDAHDVAIAELDHAIQPAVAIATNIAPIPLIFFAPFLDYYRYVGS